MLLLFTSAFMSFFNNSEDVSLAILLIFSGAPFLRFLISSSAFFISCSICSSKISFLELISLSAFSLALLKIFFASILLLVTISLYSLIFYQPRLYPNVFAYYFGSSPDHWLQLLQRLKPFLDHFSPKTLIFTV